MLTSKITQGYQILDNVNLSHPESMNDEFGYAVAADAGVVVGAYNQDINTKSGNAQISHSDILKNAGAVYIFQKEVDGNWLNVVQLLCPVPQPTSYFGRTVAISGKTIAIGMPNFDGKKGKNVGAVYIYEQKNNVWQTEPVAEFIGSEEGAKFGYKISIFGDSILIGAPDQKAGSLSKIGAAYVLEKRNGRWRKPNPLQTPTELIERNQFGRSVDIDDSLIVVGAPGPFKKGRLFRISWGQEKICRRLREFTRIFVFSR